MADTSVLKSAPIEISFHADLEAMKQAAKSMQQFDKASSNITKTFDKSTTAFGNFNKALQGTSKAIKDVLKDGDSFAKLNETVSKNVDEMKHSVSLAGNATNRFSKKLIANAQVLSNHQRQFTQYSDNYKSSVDKLNDANDRGTESAKRMQDAIKHTSEHPVKMPTQQVDHFTSKMKSAQDASEKFTHVGWSTIGMTAGLGAAFFKGAKDAANIQQQMTQITNLAVTSGEKRAHVLANVAKMTKENTALSVKYGVSQTDLAQGDEALVHAGYSTDAALAAHKTLVQGAIASGQSYNDTMQNVTNTLDQYQLRTNNVAKMEARTKLVTNELVYSVDHGKASFNDFGESMQYVGATAHSTNQKLSETMSALTVLSKAGLEGSESGTGLRKVLNSFGAAGKGMGGKSQLSVMNQLGLSDKDFHDANGHLKQIGDLMKLMRERMDAKHLNAGQRFQDMHQFFGTTGQETALILEKNANEMKGLNDQIERSDKMKGGGYVQWLAKNNMKTATNQVNMFKQAWNAFGIASANTILPAVTGLVKGLDSFLLMINKMGPTAKSVVGWSALGVAAIGPISFAVGGVIKTVNALKKATGFFKDPMSGKATDSLIRQNSEYVRSTDEVTRSLQRRAKVQADVNGEDYRPTSDNDSSNVGDVTPRERTTTSTTSNSSEVFSREASHASGLQRFVSRFHGKGSTGTGFGRVADDAHLAADVGKYSTKLGKLGGLADVAGKGIGALGVASSALGMLTMNKHNSGKVVGGTVGSMAGGALGSLLDPFTFGMGTVIGTSVGDKIGKTIGPEIGKSFHNATSQPRATQHTTELEARMKLINQRSFDQKMMSSYTKGSKDYKKYADAVKGINKQLFGSETKDANTAYKKQVDAEDKSYNQRKNDLKSMLDQKMISESKYYSLLHSLDSKHSSQLKKAEDQRKSATERTNSNIIAAYKNFYSGLGKMNDRQVANVLKKNAEQRNDDIKNAKETYSSTIKSAKKTYDQKVHYLDEFGLQNTQKGNDEIKQYKRNYDYDRSNAEKLKTSQINAANDAANHVISKAKEQHKDLDKYVNESTGAYKNLWYNISHWHWGRALGQIGHWLGSSNAASARLTRRETALRGHADGGAITTDQMSLVGEQGYELAYNPQSSRVRMLGANGPQITKLYAGEHILTAGQTNKILAGGLGKGHVLEGYASGTGEQLTMASFAGGTSQLFKSPLNTKTSRDELKKFRKKNIDSWTNIGKDTGKQTDQISKNTGKSYQDTSDNVTGIAGKMSDTLSKITSNMADDFNKVLQTLPKDAQSSMQSVVNALNQGISGIDNSLSQFGGNNNVLKPFHYAKGSDGKLANDQFAMVNDATSGPIQEAVVRDGSVYLPKHRNQLMRLSKGDAVLNGTQTQKLINNYSTVNHYAKGTGVSDSKLEAIAKSNAKNSSGFFKNAFINKAKPEGPALENGLTSSIVNGIKGIGNKWSSAMWSLINNTISGDGGGSGSLGAFLKYAEHIGMGKRYVMGATGPDAYDCSGLVYEALKHFGITVGRNTVGEQASPNVHNLGKDINKAQVGDLAIFGHGSDAAGHVGIISNIAKGLMMNATPPSGRISSIKAAEPYVPGGLAGFYHVDGLSSANHSKDKSSGLLDKLVTSELGSKALHWITNNLGETDMGGGSGVDGPAPTGDHQHWLEQAGFNSSDFSNLNWLITHESGWNPHAVNASSGAYGIPQALPASKLASAGSDWRDNPITQLRWEKGYIKGRYGSVANAVAHEHAYNWYANGGWSNRPAVFGEVPGQPEVAINPKRNSADRLIGEAISARQRVTGKPLTNFLKGRELTKRGHDMLDKLRGLLAQPSRSKSKPAVNITQNFTININGGEHDEQKLSKLIAEKIQETAYNTYGKLHLNVD